MPAEPGQGSSSAGESSPAGEGRVSGWTSGLPVLSTTTRSAGVTQPRAVSARTACSATAPSGDSSSPSVAAHSARVASASASSTATAVPPDSRRIRSSCGPPSGAATVIPYATVRGSRPRLGRRRAGLERADHRRAAGRLGGHEPGRRPGQPAQLAQLGEGLGDADQPDPAAGRVDDHLRRAPAELLGDLQAHRLLALDPVRLLERRDVEPAVAGGDGPGDHRAGVADQPGDDGGAGAGGQRLGPGHRRRAGRHRDGHGQPGPPPVRRPGRAGVAVRRQGDVPGAELAGPGRADRGTAGLEAAGRVQPLVLDQHAAGRGRAAACRPRRG